MLYIPLLRFSLIQNGPAAQKSERRQEVQKDAIVNEVISHIRNKSLSDEQCAMAIHETLSKFMSR